MAKPRGTCLKSDVTSTWEVHTTRASQGCEESENQLKHSNTSRLALQPLRFLLESRDGVGGAENERMSWNQRNYGKVVSWVRSPFGQTWHAYNPTRQQVNCVTSLRSTSITLSPVVIMWYERWAELGARGEELCGQVCESGEENWTRLKWC